MAAATPTSDTDNSRHAMDSFNPSYWRSYGHPFGSYPRLAGGTLLIGLRDKRRAARVGFSGGQICWRRMVNAMVFTAVASGSALAHRWIMH